MYRRLSSLRADSTGLGQSRRRLDSPRYRCRLLRARSFDQILLIENVVEPADHHFFPGLIAPAYLFAGIRIVLILRRVVEVRHTIKPGSLWQEQGVFELIQKLP